VLNAHAAGVLTLEPAEAEEVAAVAVAVAVVAVEAAIEEGSQTSRL